MAELKDLHLVAIGGFDPSGGAGIMRDGLTAQSLCSSFRLVGTAWAEQSPVHGVQAIDPRLPAEVFNAIRLALAESPPGRTAVKVGMTANAGVLKSIVDALDDFNGPVVFDPVLGATSGGSLFDTCGQSLPDAVAPLVARAWVLTPNTLEGARLCQRDVTTVEDAQRCGEELIRRGGHAVVVKGGHLVGSNVVDVLVRADQPQAHHINTMRVPGPSVRGTGCSYASSLALYLAAGEPLVTACTAAQAQVAKGIRHARLVGTQWHLHHE